MGSKGDFVATGTFRTHYIEEGAGEPLILLHGGGAGADSTSNWTKCLPLLGKRRRTIAPDMVGFGHTEAPDPADFAYDQDSRTNQIIAFIETLGLGPVSIVGNSMGGYTAMGVAMRRPDLVQNLILMGSAGLPADHSKPEMRALLEYDFTVDGMRRVIAALANPTFVPSEEQIRYRYELSVQPAIRAALTAILTWVRGNGGLVYPESEIAKIKTRTLVVNGKDDLVVPIAHAYRFLELLENSTGFLIPACRHWAMLEYPEMFSSLTLDFLDNYGVDSGSHR